MTRRVVWLLLAAYLVVLVLIAYWPTPVDRGAPDLVISEFVRALRRRGITVVDYDRIEFTANIVLFVPFGLLLGALSRPGRRWLAFLLCVAGSAAIELGQALFLPHRIASIADVVANSIGAALGVLAIALVARVTRSRRAGAEREEPPILPSR